MFKSIKNSLFKGREEDPKRLEKWIRKSIWQDVIVDRAKNLNLDLDIKYVSKLLEFIGKESHSNTASKTDLNAVEASTAARDEKKSVFDPVKIISKILVKVLFEAGPDSIQWSTDIGMKDDTTASGSNHQLASRASREIHQILCLTLWKSLCLQSDQNIMLGAFGLDLNHFIQLEPKAQKYLTDITLEFGEIFSKSKYGPSLESSLQLYLKHTTYKERLSVTHNNPAFPTISPQFTSLSSLSPVQIDSLLQHHGQVTLSACDMFIETLNFNTGPLGNNTLARELHVSLKQGKVDNDFLLTYTQLSESGMQLLLKCSDSLLLAFKTLQDIVEQERLAELERVVGREEAYASANDLSPTALTKPAFNSSEKGKSVGPLLDE